MSDSRELHVLIVDDSFEDRAILKRHLLKVEEFRCMVTQAKNVDEALEKVRELPPELMFIDFNMPGANGIDLLHAIRNEKRYDFPVIMLTGEGSENVAVRAMKGGAIDYLIKDEITADTIRMALVGAMERYQMEKTIEQQRRQLEVAARTDGLTGLWNRRYFDEQLELEIERASRYHHMLTLAMADLDFFKKVNDTWGHLVGDAVLMGFAEVLKQDLRMSDFAARYGGEEFCVIMPTVRLEDAAGAICRVLKHLRVKAFRNERGGLFHVTASFGLVQLSDGHTGAADILRDADQALFRAKDTGRNRIVSSLPNGEYATHCEEGEDYPTA